MVGEDQYPVPAPRSVDVPAKDVILPDEIQRLGKLIADTDRRDLLLVYLLTAGGF
jgi:hypothetical protein